MALPISVPYSFANATTSIPLSQLDTDISTIYATVNGIGNGTVALSNVVITGGIVSNVSGISTSAISNGTSNVSIATANGNVVVSTAGNTAITVDTSQNMTTVGTVAMGSSFKRNRIINGNMLIDQRNAGASVTMSTSITYITDRWFSYEDTDGVMTAQQDTSAPAGFVNSLKCTTTTADASLAATQRVIIGQRIEGFNVADLGWGSASAQTVTLSFWVRSSLTGSFGGALNNQSNRSYPFTYTISSANTWEQKTITVVGDTTGTWNTSSSVGVQLIFGLGVGSTYSGTSGAWAASDLNSVTGAVSVVGTNGATFYITGVQLEVGTKATPYEMQIYSDQLAQCQRYYYQWNNSSASGASTTARFSFGTCYSANTSYGIVYFPVPMRSTPTGSSSAASTFRYVSNGTASTGTSVAISEASAFSSGLDLGVASAAAGSSGWLSANGTNSTYFAFNAEL
jgi:hypothetical protein